MRTHLECRATPTTSTTQRTSSALRTAMVTGHLNCSIFSPIPIAPAKLIPLNGFRISKLRFTAMFVFCFMLCRAANSRPSMVLLLTGASKSSPKAVNCSCTFFFNVASMVSVLKSKYLLSDFNRQGNTHSVNGIAIFNRVICENEASIKVTNELYPLAWQTITLA